jgi:hypothetical protein
MVWPIFCLSNERKLNKQTNTHIQLAPASNHASTQHSIPARIGCHFLLVGVVMATTSSNFCSRSTLIRHGHCTGTQCTHVLPTEYTQHLGCLTHTPIRASQDRKYCNQKHTKTYLRRRYFNWIDGFIDFVKTLHGLNKTPMILMIINIQLVMTVPSGLGIQPAVLVMSGRVESIAPMSPSWYRRVTALAAMPCQWPVPVVRQCSSGEEKHSH